MDDPENRTQKPTPAVLPRHDRTGGAMSGSMVDHENYAWQQIKENQAERQADKQRHDRADPNSEPTRPQGRDTHVPSQAEAAPERGSLKQEHAQATQAEIEQVERTADANASPQQEPDAAVARRAANQQTAERMNPNNAAVAERMAQLLNSMDERGSSRPVEHDRDHDGGRER